MSVTRAIHEELEEITARKVELDRREARLREALHVLGENQGNARKRVDKGERRAAIVEAAASLSEFTVAELAHETGIDSTHIYPHVHELVAEGTLRETDKRGVRNAKIYAVVQ